MYYNIIIPVFFCTVQHLVKNPVRESRESMKSATLMYVLYPQYVFSCHTFFMQPCPDGACDFRDIQCAATDGTSFSGRFHAWEVFTGPSTYM